ncbi:hypothetical protein AGMMS49546_22080 [Spirochaetia bacterium]|nr:hypothetical protein AGMMS49546_22080 [Spirochaetia bacterium]
MREKFQSLAGRMNKRKSAVAVARKLVTTDHRSVAWLLMRRREYYNGIDLDTLKKKLRYYKLRHRQLQKDMINQKTGREIKSDLRSAAIHMSQQAFSEARQKVKREAFEELFRASVRGSYNEGIKDWRGFMLMAVDSSHIALPHDDELRAYYGAVGKELSFRTSAFTLSSGAREALITNLGEDDVEAAAFPELYYKRWPVETKYCQL